MWAPAHPVTASATVVAATVTAIRAAAGRASMTAIRGNAAPTVNEAAEAPAA